MTRPRRARQAVQGLPAIWWLVMNDEELTPAERDSIEYFMWLHNLEEPGAVDPLGEATPRAYWLEYWDGIIDNWIVDRPGTRPNCWWRWSAPRLQAGQLLGRGAGDHGDRWPQPRRRIGGTGTPTYEVRNCFPTLRFGIPNQWPDRLERDAVPPAADDPPTFEAEAAYLKRLKLFLPGEAERLERADFAPVPLDVAG